MEYPTLEDACEDALIFFDTNALHHRGNVLNHLRDGRTFNDLDRNILRKDITYIETALASVFNNSSTFITPQVYAEEATHCQRLGKTLSYFKGIHHRTMRDRIHKRRNRTYQLIENLFNLNFAYLVHLEKKIYTPANPKAYQAFETLVCTLEDFLHLKVNKQHFYRGNSEQQKPLINHRTDERLVAHALYHAFEHQQPVALVSYDRDVFELLLHTSRILHSELNRFPLGGAGDVELWGSSPTFDCWKRTFTTANTSSYFSSSQPKYSQLLSDRYQEFRSTIIQTGHQFKTFSKRIFNDQQRADAYLSPRALPKCV